MPSLYRTAHPQRAVWQQSPPGHKFPGEPDGPSCCGGAENQTGSLSSL
jgi:hypothetical protein